jgi:predicted N-acetyltransferase YhbS
MSPAPATASARPAIIKDAAACARIIYAAFGRVAGRHGFPSDYASLDDALVLARSMIASPATYGVVAEVEGVVRGCNFLVESDELRGIGPTAVDPELEERGLGRLLMESVLDRARDAAGVRLVADAFNLRSTALYASLGFEVKEPLLLMAGTLSESAGGMDGLVRPMKRDDVEACAALGTHLNGHGRRNEIAAAVELYSPFVFERGGEVRAYLTAPTAWPVNHAVAETAGDLQELLSGTARLVQEPLALLLPSRQSRLLSWFLRHGLRIVKPMTLMARGRYEEPSGASLCSIYY